MVQTVQFYINIYKCEKMGIKYIDTSFNREQVIKKLKKELVEEIKWFYINLIEKDAKDIIWISKNKYLCQFCLINLWPRCVFYAYPPKTWPIQSVLGHEFLIIGHEFSGWYES